jgi:Bacterial TSP3 repeat
MARLRSQLGQTAAEYMGVLLLVSVIIAGVSTNHLGRQIGCHMRVQVDHIFGGHAKGCGGGPEAGSPTASAASAGKDSDGDGISDADERRYGTDPHDADSDHDGVPDKVEIQRGTDPHASDSDHDGVSDKDEIDIGLNPRDRDSDHDGVADGTELDNDTDPFDRDSDGDGKIDGSDGKPLNYDGDWKDAIKGATCGDSDVLFCPDKDDPSRASVEYLTGQLLSGVFAIGDIRDIVNALAHGKVGDALWSAVGFVPAAGDAVKFGKKIAELIKRFPARKGELITVLRKLLPSKFEKAAIDAATGGGYSALQRAGVLQKTIDRLLARGNDIKKLATNAHLSERTLTTAEKTQIDNAVSRHWPPARRSEGLGMETALAELRRNPNIDIVYDGRPLPGRPVNGPDIVAVDKSTGRTIVVEAKGTQGARPLSGRNLRSTAGGRPATQTSPAWMAGNADRRYLNALRSSPHGRDQQAARLLEDIADNGGPYDVVLVNSRPTGVGGYGSGMDSATDEIRRGGQVGDIDIIDVQRP